MNVYVVCLSCVVVLQVSGPVRQLVSVADGLFAVSLDDKLLHHNGTHWNTVSDAHVFTSLVGQGIRAYAVVQNGDIYYIKPQ